MVHQLVVALKHALDLLCEGRVGVQSGDFVFILVGHQLEQVARHGLAERAALGVLADLGQHGGFGHAHLVHKGRVACGIGGVLVAGEEVHPFGHHLGQAGLLDKGDHLGGGEQGLDRDQVMRAASAPFKRRLVVVDLRAVELEGAQQRRLAQRHAALLPGKAQQQRVGVDRVADQLHRHLLGVDQAELGGTHGCA